MRLLIVDSDHCGLDLAVRAGAAGHEVRLFRYSRRPSRYGEGFGKLFALVDDWRDSMSWVGKDGMIYTTGNNKYLAELHRFRELGFRIFGPTPQSAALEIKRSVGLAAMKSVGIEVPAYQEFNSLEDAAKFARKSDRIWVFKTLGDEDDKALSFVADDPAELTGWIEQKIERGMKLKGPCILQEKINMMAELGVSGWFGSDGFLEDRWQIYFEHKKLCEGDHGPNTGEMATIMQYCETDKMADEMLKPMAPVLQALGHRGDFAVGCGVDTAGKAWPFEFTARAGWPAFWIQCASHRGDPLRWMSDLLDGEDSLRVSYDPAIGIVLAQPDFPFDSYGPEKTEGIPIAGAAEVLPDLHLVEVMKGRAPTMKNGKVVDADTFLTAGTYVAVATALGKTVSQARKKVYRTVDRVSWPDQIYRRDIGEKVCEALPALRKFGFAKDMEP